MKKLLFAVAVLIIGIPIVSSQLSAIRNSSEGSAGSLDGKKIFLDQKCNTCHSVSAAGIEAKTKMEKMKGPDLSKVTTEQDMKTLTQFLHKKEKINGKRHMKAFTGTDEELGALLSWLDKLAEKKM